jgi:hypothetical protein
MPNQLFGCSRYPHLIEQKLGDAGWVGVWLITVAAVRDFTRHSGALNFPLFE